MTFEEYLASTAAVRAAPSLDEVAEHSVIREVAEALADLPTVDRESLASVIAENPAAVRTLALAVGLSKEQLRTYLTRRLGTSGWVRLARERPNEVVAAFDEDFEIVTLIDVERGRRFEFADVLIARAGSRVSAGEAIAGGRFVEDAIEAVAVRLRLPHELRTRFAGRGNATAPCDLAVPAGGDEAKIVCAAKGFDSTGSKLSDAVREIEEMAEVRLPRQYVYAVVDGLGWHRRQADLRRIFALWEERKIDGLFTIAMLADFQTALHEAASRAGVERT